MTSMKERLEKWKAFFKNRVDKISFTRHLHKLSMGKKLWGSYIVIILFFISITIVSSKNTNQLNNHMHEIGNSKVPGVELIGTLKEEVTNVNFHTLQHAYEQNVDDKSEASNLLHKDIRDVRTHIDEMKKYAVTPKAKKQLEVFNENFKQYSNAIPQFITNSLTGNTKAIEAQMEVLLPLREKTIDSLNQLQDSIQKDSQSMIGEAEESSSRAQQQMIIVSVVVALFSILVAFLITKVIRGAVTGVVQNMETTQHSIAEIKQSLDKTVNSSNKLDLSMNKANHSVSDLVESIQLVAGNAEITASGVDEVSAAVEQMSASIYLVSESAATLAASAEESSAAIQEMVASIGQVAGSVNNAGTNVEQILAANEEISKSIKMVSENAANLTQTAAQTSETVDEMVDSIRQVASSAQTVNELSHSVQQDAVNGTASLSETLNGMRAISTVIEQASTVMKNLGRSSEEIGSIVEVIDDIADQTNLLALNAAIEAARAGEHGKGFAVVADEVRKLAERSAKATREIAVLIRGIQDETKAAVSSIQEGENRVQAGNRLAEETNLAIRKISDGITRVTEEMSQIAVATEKQTENSDFIIKAVEDVTKQAEELTNITQAQSITAEEIVKGIIETKSQFQQISMATTEQEKGSQAIVMAVEHVSSQTGAVTNATKEQALTAEEIVKNINHMKEMIQQMMNATNNQAKYGNEIKLEVESVLQQSGELNTTIETQSSEVAAVVQAIKEVNTQMNKIK